MPWVCIIDDDPQVGDVLTDVLRTAGYGARSFTDGSDALADVEAAFEAPALFLLDVMLPHMSGHDVLRRIRIGPLAKVPVIVITGLEDLSEAAFAPWGVSSVLHKPVAAEDLLAHIREALGVSTER